MTDSPALSPDVLRGADAIAEHLYGDVKFRRRVYRLAESSRLPIFRCGGTLHARKSVLAAWIEAQERQAA